MERLSPPSEIKQKWSRNRRDRGDLLWGVSLMWKSERKGSRIRKRIIWTEVVFFIGSSPAVGMSLFIFRSPLRNTFMFFHPCPLPPPSLIHSIVTRVIKLAKTKSATALAPALVETYSRLLVYMEIESLGIKGFISEYNAYSAYFLALFTCWVNYHPRLPSLWLHGHQGVHQWVHRPFLALFTCWVNSHPCLPSWWLGHQGVHQWVHHPFLALFTCWVNSHPCLPSWWLGHQGIHQWVHRPFLALFTCWVNSHPCLPSWWLGHQGVHQWVHRPFLALFTCWVNSHPCLPSLWLHGHQGVHQWVQQPFLAIFSWSFQALAIAHPKDKWISSPSHL